MTRVLIANRGEIAVRIVRACRGLGIESVAVYSDADAHAAHVRLADHAVRIGPEDARQSYLDIDAILAAAAASGADAVHPGYGFLSENADFVDRVVADGLTFIGPSASAMRTLGDKARAKQAAASANVPIVPEWDLDDVPADAFPVLVKAAAGGGGRGMRRVDRPADLAEAIVSARREALAGFGDDTLIVEQLVTGARHVEIQLLADAHGNARYVGDRDCSLQRRHQKVVEEAPAPGLPHALRMAMGEAAVRLAQAASYVNAGTAEFLVAPDGRFFFLELNARLQVEHPVTEEAFGIDLAQWQLRIARGERLTFEQDQLTQRAHAIEARLYAEDPVTFLPTGGELVELHLPSGSGVRVDHGLTVGARVSLAYDPLLAKVIATGPTRDDARRRLIEALQELSVLGAITNAALLLHALELPDFVAGTHDIATLESNLLDASAVEPSAALVAAARARISAPGIAEDVATSDPFRAIGAWRQAGLATDVDAGEPLDADATGQIRVTQRGDDLWFSADGVTYQVPRSPIATSIAAAGIDSH
ncbi:MAG: acetyl/propionyl-CoA carboxylase subunit alpha, partial [Thermoleophilia bacterium]|nr:acetyl/propionyl-CoA carboxylase subunit alpha [Thermoleophilia bacterium]